MRYLIYNFSGLPGDLFQLVPDKFLAHLLSVLNQRDPGAAEVWDRSNLSFAESLAPGKALGGALQFAGKRVFRNIEQNGRVSKPNALTFGAISSWTSRRSNHRVHRLLAREADAIVGSGAEVLFVNLRHGPGFDHSVQLVRRLRNRGADVRIFGIGHRPSWFPRELADLYPEFDAFVIGPSSYGSMLALAEGAAPGEVPNVVMKRDGELITTERIFSHDVQQDTLFPDYDPQRYRGVEAQLPMRELVLANEACPFACHFCIRPVLYGTKWQAREVEQVVDEMEHQIRNQGVRCFRCSDSTPPPGMLTAVAEEIIRRGLPEFGLHISSFGRVNRNLREDYATLRQAGFDSLFFGIESGSPRVLNEVLGKQVTPDEAVEAISAAREAGLAPVASFMFPTPGETRESRTETLDLLRRLKPFVAGALILPSCIYPDTPWHLEADRFRVHLDEDYVAKTATYPVEPLKPLRLWPAFGFRYELMGKPAEEVTFQDIVSCYEEFTREVWGSPEHGGLGIPNIQDYCIVLANYLGVDPEDLSRQSLIQMVTRNVESLNETLQVCPA